MPIQTGEIAEDLAHYLAESEQVRVLSISGRVESAMSLSSIVLCLNVDFSNVIEFFDQRVVE